MNHRQLLLRCRLDHFSHSNDLFPLFGRQAQPKRSGVGEHIEHPAVGNIDRYGSQLGAFESGIEMDRRAIAVNGRMETSVPDVYACGDAIGGIMLAHVASAEGKVAVANALGGQDEMDYTAIPSVVYTHPEIGSTGLSEAEAGAKGIDVTVGTFSFRASGKARAEGEREGLVKIVADAASGKVLGGQICGPHATDLIHEVVLAVRLGATVQQLGDMVHAHPTLMEPIMEAAEDVLGRAIHK